jgi:glycosyltransferase involved in cell wall biosynthesis
MTHHGDASLRIALLGTRGIPGRYGGFETFAEELGARLVERGHAVTVYCRGARDPSDGDAYRGVRLVHLPALRHKYAETLSHTLLSAVHAAFRRYDIVYVCNSANAPICFIPWARRQRTVLNVDGLEWQRKKWGAPAKRYYRWAARLAAHMPIEVVTDASVIHDFYRKTWGRETRCIPYGTALFDRGHLAERLSSMGLEPDGYVLYVSRLEPENNAKLVVEAYREVATGVPLVIVGDAPYARSYIAEVRRAADDRVRFLGYRFGDDYHALQANARLYVQATEVGGTHPALVEALGHRNAVVAHDVPEHREVVGDAGTYYGFRDRADLAREIGRLLAAPEEVADLRERAARRVEDRFSWRAVTDEYERYFHELVGRRA